jgi:osomolarity two-component system sensor histidine kinase CHK1
MMSGESLDIVHSKMIAAKSNIRRFKQETGMWWLSVPLQLVLNLRGMGNPDPLCFEGEALGSSKDLARLASSESLSHIYMYHMYRLIIAALYGSRVQFLVFINVFALITLRLLGTHG